MLINNNFNIRHTIIFFLFASIVVSANTVSFFGSVNIRPILFICVSVLFFFHFYGEIVNWIIHNKNLFLKILFFCFILHPFLIFFLLKSGYSNFLESGITTQQIFLRSANIIFQILIFIYIYNCFKERNYKFIFNLFLFLSIVFFIQYLFLILKNYPTIALPNHSLKDLLFRNEQYTAIIPLLAFIFSFSKFLVKRKIAYLIFSIICLIIIYASFQRSAMVASFIFIFLALFSSKIFTFRQILILLLSLLLIAAIYYFFLLSRENLFNIKSLLERFVFWINGLNIFYDYFPFGVGANNNENYFHINSLIFINNFWDYVVLIEHELLKQRVRIFFDYNDLISLHSTQIDILADFGLLGFIGIIMYYYFPIKIILQTYRKSEVNAVLARNYACGVIGTSFFYLMLSNMQLLWINLIIFSYMIYLYNNFRLIYGKA